MNYLLLDTCVWVNLSSDLREFEILSTLDRLVKENKIILLIPDIVRKEYDKNKSNTITTLQKNFRSHAKNIQNLGKILLLDTDMNPLIDKIDKAINQLSNNTSTTTQLVYELFDRNALQLASTDMIRLQAIDRAIHKKAPFHHNHNSMADAIILEEFAYHAAGLLVGAEMVCFVTNNTSDFSNPKDHRLPHDDIVDIFNSSIKIKYSINIGTTLNDIEANSISKETITYMEYADKYGYLSCQSGGAHTFTDIGWLPSIRGGHSWHLRCSKCGYVYDTEEFSD